MLDEFSEYLKEMVVFSRNIFTRAINQTVAKIIAICWKFVTVVDIKQLLDIW